MTNLLEMIKDKKVKFVYFKNNELWYETDDGFLFPVPTYDVGDAKFLNEDKAILFMRWIKKELQTRGTDENS